jgi:hypothetical protein
MRNIKLPILITVVVLASMSILGASISCKISTGDPGDISSDKESIEEVTEVEEVQETNTANIWISEAVPDFIRNEVEYELDRIFDETTIVRQKEDSEQ